MSMRDNNHRLTICEVLRCINDKLQGNEYSDIRDMLALAERMAKRIIIKLQEYNKKEDPQWWIENHTATENFNRSVDSYMSGNPDRGWELLCKK